MNSYQNKKGLKIKECGPNEQPGGTEEEKAPTHHFREKVLEENNEHKDTISFQNPFNTFQTQASVNSQPSLAKNCDSQSQIFTMPSSLLSPEAQWQDLLELTSVEYEQFLIENQERVALLMNPPMKNLDLESIRKQFLTDDKKHPPVDEPHSLMSILLPHFLAHSSEILFPKEQKPYAQSKSTLLFKRTGNHIPLFVCREFEKARNWAVEYLIQNQNNSQWRFAFATTGKSWSIFVIRNNNQRFQRDFEIFSPNRKETLVYEDLLRNLLIIIGFDVQYPKSVKKYPK